jgi:pyruvate kinase
VTFIPFDTPSGRSELQLVVTIGPASLGSVGALARAGATGFRLNASHLEPQELANALERVRQSSAEAPIVVDLQGAKMRVELGGPCEVAEGDALTLAEGRGAGPQVPHPEFFAQVSVGDTLSIDDGRMRFVVESVDPGRARVRALNAGRLQHRKGINVEQHPVHLGELTRRDRDACAVAAAYGVATFAYSFMTDGHEADWVRAEAPGCTVVGKVERREATVRIDDIAAQVGAIWVCRGDLGAQLGLAGLARFVGGFDPASSPVPVLMAGQVLEHLTSHPEPTRSEVCHLYDLVARGFSGIVLSDETAIGRDPAHATEAAARILDSFRA